MEYNIYDSNFSDKRKNYHKRNYRFNPHVGQCMICGKPSIWSEDTGKYSRICGADACKKALHDIHVQNTKAKYGVEYRMQDNEYQRLLHGRQGRAKKITVDGKEFYTLSNVESIVLDKLLNHSGYTVNDIEAPATFNISYYMNGVKKEHIPDIYLKPLNLIISCKDGLDNPNTHPGMNENRLRAILEYQSILNNTDYNFVQIEGNNEAKDVLKIIQNVEKAVKNRYRYIVPPRIDVVMYKESEDIEYDLKKKIRFILFSENDAYPVFNLEKGQVVTRDGIKTLDDIDLKYSKLLPITDTIYFEDIIKRHTDHILMASEAFELDVEYMMSSKEYAKDYNIFMEDIIIMGRKAISESFRDSFVDNADIDELDLFLVRVKVGYHSEDIFCEHDKITDLVIHHLKRNPLYSNDGSTIYIDDFGLNQTVTIDTYIVPKSKCYEYEGYYKLHTYPDNLVKSDSFETTVSVILEDYNIVPIGDTVKGFNIAVLNVRRRLGRLNSCFNNIIKIGSNEKGEYMLVLDFLKCKTESSVEVLINTLHDVVMKENDIFSINSIGVGKYIVRKREEEDGEI